MAGYIGRRLVNTLTDLDGVAIDGASITNSTIVPTSSFMFRNKVINGDMRIDQRNGGTSVTPTGDAYTLDRWSTWVYQSSKFSVQQNAGSVTPPVGFSNYLGITSTSAYSVPANEGFAITQKIEGYNVADLGWGAAGALTVTLSFWVRSSLTGTFGGAINNSAQSRSYPFNYQITLPNTWEYKTITIDGDTSGTWLTTNGNGFFVKLGLGVGSALSGTAGSWATANYASSTGATSVAGTSGATFYITGVQLEEGTVATPFEHRPIGTELALCQRYFYKTTGVIYGTPGSVGYALWYLKTSMRATPTITGIPAGRTNDYTTTEYVSLYTNSGYPYFASPTASAEL